MRSIYMIVIVIVKMTLSIRPYDVMVVAEKWTH